MKNSRCFILLVTFLALAVPSWSQVPPIINYQGRVILNNTNFAGNGAFKFALVNAAGTISYWSNDGTSSSGSEPTAAVTLIVVNGLYSVLLGDVTLPNMTAIPLSAFGTSDVRLRVWFNGGPGFQRLAPDQRIAAVAYALVAASVPDGAITTAKLADGTVTGPKLAPNSVTSAALGDSVALGTNNVAGRLDIYRTAVSTPALSLIGSSSQISTFGSDGLEQVRVWGPSYGEILLNENSVSNFTTVRLSAHETSPFPFASPIPGGALSLTLGNTNRVYLKAGTSGGQLTLFQNDGGVGILLDGDDGGAGSISVRSTNGNTRVFLDGDSSGGGLVDVRNTNGTTKVRLDGYGGNGAGDIQLYNSAGDNTIALRGAEGAAEGGEIALYNGAGTKSVEIDGEVGTGGGGWIGVRNANGSTVIELDAEDATGAGRVTTQVLQITGGSDLSENFDINAAGDAIKPGMIVCIDPDHPGRLVSSAKSYDNTVAGVVSGAGGVRPGMLMGQHGSVANGKHPVALSGRVYCWVDATPGAIRPGDLVTTSDTPGHGMKVTDHHRAQGAIIGKAMSPLAQGRGLVLILVSLQ